MEPVADRVKKIIVDQLGVEEETVTRLPSKAFDEFLKALDKPMPQAARWWLQAQSARQVRFSNPWARSPMQRR